MTASGERDLRGPFKTRITHMPFATAKVYVSTRAITKVRPAARRGAICSSNSSTAPAIATASSERAARTCRGKGTVLTNRPGGSDKAASAAYANDNGSSRSDLRSGIDLDASAASFTAAAHTSASAVSVRTAATATSCRQNNLSVTHPRRRRVSAVSSEHLNVDAGTVDADSRPFLAVVLIRLAEIGVGVVGRW
jgi:hypothetical protein